MSQSAKVTTFIIVVLLLAGGALWIQFASSRVESTTLSSKDVEFIVSQFVPPQRQHDLAESPQKRAELMKDLRNLFAVAQAAREEAYLERSEVDAQVKLLADQEVYAAYKKKYPDTEASDAEIAEYYRQNANVFERFLAGNPRFQSQGADREALRREYGQLRLFCDRGRSEGLDQSEEIRLKVLFKTSQYLFSVYQADLKKKTDATVSDAEIKQHYSDHPEGFEEVRARHILVATGGGEQTAQNPTKPQLTKDEARKLALGLLERIRQGEDFAKVAEERSDDPGSKVKGGDLGYFSKGQMTPPFEAAAFALSIGQVSEPIETEFGIHIIKVEARRTANLDSKTQQAIGNKLKQEKLTKMIERIAANQKVEMPQDFNPAPAPEGDPSTPR